jgi:DNA-binding MarR family transcriptional regulator
MDQKTRLPETKSNYRLDEQVGFLLRLASQRHAVIFQKHIGDDLTSTQFATLMRVAEHGEVSQNHLGRLAAMDGATIKGVVDRLKQKKLLLTRSDPSDKRLSIISLTQDGVELMTLLEQKGLAITLETLLPLKPTEQKRFLELLLKLS